MNQHIDPFRHVLQLDGQTRITADCDPPVRRVDAISDRWLERLVVNDAGRDTYIAGLPYGLGINRWLERHKLRLRTASPVQVIRSFPKFSRPRVQGTFQNAQRLTTRSDDW
jgi:hypothetical protein